MNQSFFGKIALFAGVVAFSAACNQQVQTRSTPSIAPTVSTNATQTYTNSTYNFSFEYGKDFTFVTPTYGSLNNQIVQVQMDNSAYPKTNFDDADFTVSQDYAKTLADCLKLPSNGSGNNSYTAQKINGAAVYFNNGKTGGAGAGNFYAVKEYVAYNNMDCIVLDETIHTGDIGNYSAGTVTEVKTASIQSELDQILDSFKFTK